MSSYPREVKLKEVKLIMAEPEIHTEVEHVSIEHLAGGDDTLVETPEGEEPAEGAEPEPEGEEEAPATGPKEQLVRSQVTPPAPAAAAAVEPAVDPDPSGLVRQPGETVREFAMRAELTRTRGMLRQQRGQELLGEPNAAAAPVAKPAAQTEILSKYRPEEIKALQEVAEALGFVKADQLQTKTYGDKGQEYLDSFLDKHPEYSPENDTDGKLWDAFKGEFGIYKQPSDPRDFPRIFNKVHAAVFGLQPQGAGGKTAAATEKVTVASRGSAAAPSNTARPAARAAAAPAGLRKDMLKGFTAEEMEEMGI